MLDEEIVTETYGETVRAGAATGGPSGAGRGSARGGPGLRGRGAGGRSVAAAGRLLVVRMGRAVQQGTRPPRLAGNDDPDGVRGSRTRGPGPLRCHRGTAGLRGAGGGTLDRRPADRPVPAAFWHRRAAGALPARDRGR